MIVWDGRDASGREVATGIYAMHVRAEDSITARNVIRVA